MSPLGHQPLSPLDGRYREATEALGEYFSEAALNRARVRVEIEWLIALCAEGVAGTTALPAKTVAALRAVGDHFGPDDINKIAAYEAVTKHDVKAVEYYVRDVLAAHGLDSVSELVHFGCTSEDINNVSYALVTRDAVAEVWLPAFDGVATRITELAHTWRDAPMLAKTHGQPATPTTFGKELAVFSGRLSRVRHRIAQAPYLAKFSGATGTFSAHVVAEPGINWPIVSKNFVEGLGLTWNPLTTQIESHDGAAELFTAISHANRILHNLATDVWTYISVGYLTQIPEPGATGSSTMPHKINPIRFENAEANLEISSSLLDGLAATLVTSRLQRDLTDSSTQRNMGVGFGHSLLALTNLHKGLHEISLNEAALMADLRSNWEVLAEAIQTVMRAEIVRGNSDENDPYAIVKELTRGQAVDAEALASFVKGLNISEAAKKSLEGLTPQNYVGLASALVDYLD
ncbi:MAG TPA: adenylosuccinate lyase [Pontimonas sp.]|nr:adenylosuccinate lyase [Pontimonas sp.]